MRRIVPLLLLLFATAISAYAQSGAIQGTLLDPQGNAIANAKVVAIDEAKGVVVRETSVDKDGSFQLLPLPRGTYTVQVEAGGFKKLDRKGLVLDAYQILNLGGVKLEVGEITNTVQVTAETPLVETATAQKSFVITSEQVTGVSTNGRDFRSLLRTLPGVTSNAQSDFNLGFNTTLGFNVNGLRDTANNVFLDGAINTDVGANDGQYTQMSLDAIGEFKVQSSVFSAEHGRNPGVLISATTKSGGRQFHGTAYEFLRNDALDARDPLAAQKQPLRLNQFGGNIGGPIALGKISPHHDPKLFFFFNMEGTRGSRPNGPAFEDVPNSDILNGDFRSLLRSATLTGSSCLYPGETAARPCQQGTVFHPGTVIRNAQGNIIGGQPYANNIVPKSEWNQNAPAFLKLIGAIDRTGAAPVPGSPQLVRVFSQDQYQLSKRQEVARIDYTISSRANFFFRWVDDSQREEQGLGIFATNSFPYVPQFRKKPGSSWSWNLVNVISPTVTNEFIFSYNHLTQLVDIPDGVNKNLYDRDALGFTFNEPFPDANLRNRYPNFNCGIGACNFPAFPSEWASEGRQFAWTDNLTLVKGAHTFKTGVFFNMNRNGQQPTWTDTTALNFSSSSNNPLDTGNSFANMLLGNYTSASQSNGKFFGAFRFYGLEFFGQDSWKVNSRLTLEYGARYAYLGPTYTTGDLLKYYFFVDKYDPAKAVSIQTAPGQAQGSIIPGSGDPLNGLVREGNGIPSGGVDHRKNQIAPRFGFAWDLYGDGRTAIRGGFGEFFERERQNNAYFDGLGNPPVLSTPQFPAGNLDNLGPNLVNNGGLSFPANLIAVDPNGKIPTIWAWNLDIQNELPWKIGLDVSYNGNVAHHLMYQRDINTLPLGTALSPTVPNALRPFPGYGSITYVEFGASSNYQSLQARLSRRFGSNLTFNFNYTWSKAIDDTDNDTDTIAYAFDRARERAVSGFDRTHVFTFDYIYHLPDFAKKLGDKPVTRTIVNGWQVSGVTRIWSGLPFSVTANGNPGTLGGGPRADYLGGQIIVKDYANRQWFDPLVFGSPQNGALGDTGRNFLRGPGFTNFDLSLFKDFRFTERLKLQYRAEFFNIFNHTQWFGINTSVSATNPGSAVTPATSGTSGQLNSTRDARKIQMALKLTF
ncbi:MAG: TonB-dependent receptor [Blastocatellia bacterium]|nr:TonB-dependent receptor [Blastocatellia bacterium]